MSNVISGTTFAPVDIQICDVVTFEGGDSVVITDSMDDMFKGYSLIDGAARYLFASEVQTLNKGRFENIENAVSAIKDVGGLR